MKSIKKAFRNSYLGEDVYSSAIYKNGLWEYTTEYVQKTLDHQNFNKTAIIIGNGVSRLDFQLNNLTKPYIKKKIATYGCNALYREFTPDFLICTRPKIIKEVVESGYSESNITYAPGTAILDYPKSFHLIPQDPGWNSGSLAAYLACFDGCSKVVLLGFDGNDTPTIPNNVFTNSNGYTGISNYNDRFMATTLVHVMKTYSLVDFVLVNSTGRGYMPKEWYNFANLRRLSFRDLILECDL